MNRDYTNAHPDEPCEPCRYFIVEHARCTYKSKKYFCVRDEWNAKGPQLNLWGDDDE